jgi:predicted nucleic acid-binding protein
VVLYDSDVIIEILLGRRAGAYLARHARSDGVEIADALVTAAASTSGLVLWTRNRRRYPMADVRLHAS